MNFQTVFRNRCLTLPPGTVRDNQKHLKLMLLPSRMCMCHVWTAISYLLNEHGSTETGYANGPLSDVAQATVTDHRKEVLRTYLVSVLRPCVYLHPLVRRREVRRNITMAHTNGMRAEAQGCTQTTSRRHVQVVSQIGCIREVASTWEPFSVVAWQRCDIRVMVLCHHSSHSVSCR